MNYSENLLAQYLPRLSVALISATVLAYEVLLTRLFAIAQWHHFAYMVISIALLGFGASGTFLALKSNLVNHFKVAYVISLILFGILALPCFLLAQQFSIHPEQLLWEPKQMMRVTIVYMLLALPFFFAANAIGLALMHYRHTVSKIYAADLIGAGCGGVMIVGALYFLAPIDALKALSALALVTAIIAGLELRFKWVNTAITSVTALGLLIALQIVPTAWLSQSISPYKSMSQQLNVIDTYTEAERSSPLGMLSVIASPTVPLRHAPGLSLNAIVEIPEQRGVFIDGDGITPIDRYRKREDSAYLDHLTSALPYHLKQPQHAVILGAGGGSLVRQALYHDTPSVTAVELDPQIIKLVREDYREFSGGLYDIDRVNIQIEEARGFFAGNTQSYDLIQVGLIDSFAASSAGLYALNENYLYTVEALGEFYTHLNKGGYLAISRWVKLPPRDALKLFATAVRTLQHAGIENPGAQLLMIRGWQTSTLLMKNGRFTPEEISNARNFCEQHAFDLAFYHGMPETQANQYNVLSQPFFYQGALSLSSESYRQFLNKYKFSIEPATDDQPYFFYFFKWRTLPEVVSLVGRGGIPLLESGYLILIVTFIQAVLISIVFVVLPLYKHIRDNNVRWMRMAMYFTILGFAFFFVEIAFIQKFLLFLHNPVLAVAVVLSGFLVFAGIGSNIASRWQTGQAARYLVITAVFAIVILGMLYAFVIPGLVFEPLIGASMSVKVAVSLALIGLLAIPMGMPFPLGLARLSEQAEKQIPTAWAINGCASVISAILATVIAIHFGFTVVVMLAVILYFLAAAIFEF